MNVEIRDRVNMQPAGASKQAIADCDIHQSLKLGSRRWSATRSPESFIDNARTLYRV